MKTIQQLLDQKRPGVLAVSPEDTVLHALMLLAEHDIGALLVLEQGRLVGIFSERDYARKVVLRGRTSKATPVRQVMSEKVVYVTPDRTVEECMALMTQKHIRHLPVLDANGEVTGMLSIGDLVKETISQQAFLIEQLERYITG